MTRSAEKIQKPWSWWRRLPGHHRSTLWIGFLIAIMPLLVLLGLQYRWLTALEQTSTVAREKALQNYLVGVVERARFFYRSTGERALNLPAVLFEPQYLHKVEKYFGKKKIPGARQLFIVTFPSGEKRKWKLFYYNAKTRSLEAPPASDEVAAVKLAITPWHYLPYLGDTDKLDGLTSEERDPQTRILLNPITDDASQLVGLAGMIVDQDHFRDVVLPKAVEEALPKFSKPEDELIVTVRDQRGNVVYQSADGDPRGDEITMPFELMFSDWRIGVRSRHKTPQQWARANFAFNLTLSGLLAAVLIGGILLVLRTAAREMKLSEMKNDFVSNVSHELRTPLSSIRVFGEFLRLGRVKSEEKIREYGEYIESESRRLTQLINNILDFSHIESGRKLYTFEPTELDEVVSDVVETFRVRLQHEGFELELRSPPHPLPKISVDAGALAQAVCNLLDNAVKYSNGGRKIAVVLEERDEQLVIAVEDDGIGISAEEQQRIFERFHRVGTGLVHDVKGSGLGLSIVHHIVRAHGGTIEVESELGKGSVFSICLPRDGETRKETGEPPPDAGEGDAAPHQQGSGI